MISLGIEQQASEVKVCNVCGHRGWSNALILCSDCQDTSVHQYCVGIRPGSIDTNKWVCHYCPTSSNSESTLSWMFGGTSVQGSLKSCTDYSGCLKNKSANQIVAVEDLPEPLCILLPIRCNLCSHQAYSSNQSAENTSKTYTYMGQPFKKLEEQEEPFSFMECPKSIMSEVVLLVTPSGEIITHESSVSSFMEQPKPITDGLVLFASASGLITIDEVMSSHDCPHCHGFNGFHEAGSDNVYSGLSYNYVADETANRYGENVDDYCTEELIGLNESYFGTDGNLYACDPPEVKGFTVNGVDAADINMYERVIQVNGSSKTDGMEIEDETNGVSNNSFGNAVPRRKRKRKRMVRLSDLPESNQVKEVSRDERKNSVECLAHRQQRRRLKDWLSPEYVKDKDNVTSNNTIDDLRIEIPFEEALSAEAEKESIMKQIFDRFRSAGWTVTKRIKKSKSSKCVVRLFRNPEGRCFLSAAKACKALQCGVLDSKVKVSLETALSVGDRKSIKKQVLGMLLGAGWELKYKNLKRVYVSPEGETHKLFIKAYGVLQQEVVEGKGNVKAGRDYLNSIRSLVEDKLLREGWTLKPKHCKGSPYTTKVYVSPEGKSHWSIIAAYHAIQQNGAGVVSKRKSAKY